MAVVLFIAGLVMLVGGAEILVRGASRLAALMHVPSLIVGLTIVAFGTSCPELAVSVQSALAGKADIALGNVVGSNIFNVLFILGLSAIIAPLAVSLQLVRFDVPIMIGASVLTFIMALDGAIGRMDGLILFSLIVVYTVWLIIKTQKSDGTRELAGNRGQSSTKSALVSVFYQATLIAGGLILLVIGSRILVTGAVTLARILGISELVIGLTIVAAGTSLPEAATSIVAAIRHERDIAVGNIVGSNIFNIFSVLGLASAIVPGGVAVNATALHFDIPVMIAVAFACLPVFFTGSRIARWEGFLFFGYYVAYTVYLTLSAKQGIMWDRFNHVMGVFVIPFDVGLLYPCKRVVANRSNTPNAPFGLEATAVRLKGEYLQTACLVFNGNRPRRFGDILLCIMCTISFANFPQLDDLDPYAWHLTFYLDRALRQERGVSYTLLICSGPFSMSFWPYLLYILELLIFIARLVLFSTCAVYNLSSQ